MGEASGVCLERLYILMRIFGLLFSAGRPDSMNDVPQITGQHRWRSKTLWNELKNSDLTNPPSYSRFQLAPPQTKRWRKNTNFGLNTFDFGFLPMGIGARPYTSSLFFSFGRARCRNVMAPSRGSIPSCGFALELSGWNSGRRLCRWAGFVVDKKPPNDRPKMGLNSTSHGFPSFWA